MAASEDIEIVSVGEPEVVATPAPNPQEDVEVVSVGDEPEVVSTEESPAGGSLVNRTLDVLAPVAATAMNTADQVLNFLTGTTETQAAAEKATVADQRAVHLPEVPDVPGLTRKEGAGAPLMGFAAMAVLNDEVAQMTEAEKNGELTATGKRLLANKRAQQKANETLHHKAPRAPSQRNTGLGGMTAFVTDDEVGAIAQQYKVDPALLLGTVSRMGGKLESTKAQDEAGEGESFAQSAANVIGYLDQAVALGAGDFADRKLNMSKQERRAVEDLRSLIQQRQGAVRLPAEIAGGIASGLALTKTLTGAAAQGAARLAKIPAAMLQLAQQADAAAAAGQALTPGMIAAKTAVDAAKVGVIPLQTATKLATAATDLADSAAQMGLGAVMSTREGDSPVASMALMSPFLLPPLISVARNAIRTNIVARNMELMAGAPQIYERAMEKAYVEAPTALNTIKGVLSKTTAEGSTGIADEATAAQVVGLARSLGAETTDPIEAAKFLRIKNMQEPKLIEDATRRMLVEQAFHKEVDDSVVKSLNYSSFGRITDFFSAAPVTAAIYDKKHGTAVMQTLDKLSGDAALGQAVTNRFLIRTNEIRKALLKNKPKGAQEDEYLAAMVKQVEAGTAPAEVQAGLREYFDAAKDWANSTGRVNVVELLDQTIGKTNYMPRRLLTGNDMAVAIVKKLRSLGVELDDLYSTGAARDDIIKRIRDNGVSDLFELGEGRHLHNNEILDVIIAKTRPGGTNGMDDVNMRLKVASALQQRTGNTIDWAIERNPIKAMNGYINDLTRMVYEEPHIRELKHFQKVAGTVSSATAKTTVPEAYDKNMAAFLNTVVDGLTVGGDANWPGKVLARTERVLNLKLRLAAERVGKNTMKGKTLQAVADLPTGLLDHVKRTMYGGVLGVSNVKAPIQNVIQPIVMGLPEFGNVYGAEVAARSLAASARNFLAEGASKTKNTVMNAVGMVGSNPRPANTSSMSDATAAKLGRQQLQDQAANASYMLAGSRDSELRAMLNGEMKEQGFTAKAADKLTEASMLVFNASERFSRTWAIGIADKIFEDLVAGRPEAQKVISNLKGSYGNSIIRAMNAGNEEGAKELLRRYTLGRVVLNYDKASQSAFVREMGPLFSSFTRWPTESLARANYSLRTGGVRGAIKDTSAHLPVFTALLLAEQALSSNSAYREDDRNLAKRSVSRDPAFKNDPRLNQVFGARGPTAMSMMTSAVDTATSFAGGAGLIPGNQQQSRHMPPAVQLGLETASGLVGAATAEEGSAQYNAAMRQLRRAADLGAKLTVPGISMVELFTKTIPNLTNSGDVVTEGVGGKAFGKLMQGE